MDHIPGDVLREILSLVIQPDGHLSEFFELTDSDRIDGPKQLSYLTVSKNMAPHWYPSQLSHCHYPYENSSPLAIYKNQRRAPEQSVNWRQLISLDKFFQLTHSYTYALNNRSILFLGLFSTAILSYLHCTSIRHGPCGMSMFTKAY